MHPIEIFGWVSGIIVALLSILSFVIGDLPTCLRYVLGIVAAIVLGATAIWSHVRKQPDGGLTTFQKERHLVIERRKHYGRLNENIFKPLRDYKPRTPPLSPIMPYWERSHAQRWNDLRLDYDTSRIRSSPYFEDAQKHLAKDLPTFIPTLSEVERSVKRLNDEVNGSITIIEAKVKDTLSKIASVTEDDAVPPSSIYMPSVMTILESFWFSTILYRYSKSKDIDTVVASLTTKETELQLKHESDGLFRLGGHGVARLPSESLEKELALTLAQLRQDRDILNKIVGFAERKEELEMKGCELAEQIDRIVYLIEAEHYDTICECCPK